ncbi:hypothetical protein [Kitasatospora acidiphila]|uniref:hypothetical protein n=1 Tax=Kitasatospora acidiphila TaxID=2567942 RepID=UPI003C771F9B
MNQNLVWLVLAARSRVALAVAGLAWLLGFQPGVPGRVLLAVLVAIVLVVDAVSGESERRLARTSRVRRSGGGGR